MSPLRGAPGDPASRFFAWAFRLKNVHDVTGLPLEKLVRTTSWNQAIEQGWGKKLGKVEKGYIADLVVINPRSWKPSAVFVDGEQRI